MGDDGEQASVPDDLVPGEPPAAAGGGDGPRHGRIRELLDEFLAQPTSARAVELSLCVDSFLETQKERSVRLRALEEETRQLQARVRREHQGYIELRASMDELLDLSELSETISSSFDIQDIMAATMELSARFLKYEACGFFVWDGEHEELSPMALRGEQQLSELVLGLREDGIIDWVSREGHPVVIEDMNTLDHPGVAERSIVIIPLRVRGKDLGVYALHCAKAKDAYTAGQIDLLGVLANQAATAIDNARLYNDLDTAHRRLQESQSQILLSSKLAAIGELAGGVAHEVNNPLQIILSRVQLMMIQHQKTAHLLSGLTLIEANVKRISRIIRALLGFAGHNLREGDWDTVDIPAALQQAYALVEHQLEKHLIETTLECEDDLPRITGKTGELEQVFINLLFNAQHAMPKGGRLRIRARREDEQVAIQFSDTGVGIAAEHLDRIFEPFFTTRGKEGGTGLGLAVSYGIIEMHHGTITVESEPGAGATFIIRLPVSRPEQDPVAADDS